MFSLKAGESPIVDMRWFKTDVKMPDGEYLSSEPVLKFRREDNEEWQDIWFAFDEPVILPQNNKKSK